jgi:hypothetical protein
LASIACFRERGAVAVFFRCYRWLFLAVIAGCFWLLLFAVPTPLLLAVTRCYFAAPSSKK